MADWEDTEVMKIRVSTFIFEEDKERTWKTLKAKNIQSNGFYIKRPTTIWRFEKILKLQRPYFRSLYKDIKGEEHNNKVHMNIIRKI